MGFRKKHHSFQGLVDSMSRFSSCLLVYGLILSASAFLDRRAKILGQRFTLEHGAKGLGFLHLGFRVRQSGFGAGRQKAQGDQS